MTAAAVLLVGLRACGRYGFERVPAEDSGRGVKVDAAVRMDAAIPTAIRLGQAASTVVHGTVTTATC